MNAIQLEIKWVSIENKFAKIFHKASKVSENYYKNDILLHNSVIVYLFESMSCKLQTYKNKENMK